MYQLCSNGRRLAAHGQRAPGRRISTHVLGVTVLSCFILILLAFSSGAAAEKKKREQGADVQAPVFYPDLPATPRIQYLATYNGESDVKPKMGRFRRFALGADEDSLETINKPYGVAFRDGDLFVCDIRGSYVMILGIRDKTAGRMGDKSPGRLSMPINMIIDEDGTRFVADSGLRRVVVFDKNNNYLRAFGDPEALRPVDVAVYGDLLYVCDRGAGTVLVLDKFTGEELRRVAREGSGEGELYMPTNLALDESGNLYISDTGNARVLLFDAQGNYLRQIGARGRAMGLLARPKGIAVDRQGRLYVVDAAFENVQVFDTDGRLLLFFGTPGNHPGGMNLPTKVVIDYDNVDLFRDRVAPGYEVEYLLVVTSQYGLNKVNVYGSLKVEEDTSKTTGEEE